MLFALDELVLKKCTQFSHFLQKSIGLTNFFVVRLGIFMYTLSIGVRIGSYWFPNLMTIKSSSLWVVIYVLISINVIYDLDETHKNEERLYSNKPLLLPRRLQYSNPRTQRLFWFVLSFFDFCFALGDRHIGDVIGNRFFSWGLMIVYYFLSVKPLPPGANWLGQAIEKIRLTFNKPVPVSN